ncbi:MAG: dimethylsulfonioproprionate lyase family protein [Geminicoccaceae bacterium]
MPDRDLLLQQFLTSLAEAFRVRDVGPQATAAIGRIYAALQSPRPAGAGAPQHLPVCRFLSEAIATARAGSPPVARLAEAFAALTQLLAWAPRAAGGPFASDNWPEGHANATIVGVRGLEDRDDLFIGASLLAPHVRYPDHRHAPEEVYLVLSPGRFQHGDSGWFEPGVGGTLYNRPNIKHAMASGDAPLLALWCLWAGKPGPIDEACRDSAAASARALRIRPKDRNQ